MRMQIRCCCVPAKVLGTVEVDNSYAIEGMPMTFPLTEAAPKSPPPYQAIGPEPPRVTMRVAEYYVNRMQFDGTIERKRGLALKADGLAEDAARRIVGFEPWSLLDQMREDGAPPEMIEAAATHGAARLKP